MTANEILVSLITNNPNSRLLPDWISQAAAYVHPPKYGGTYETTAVNFFPEVTVRPPTEGTTRRGKPRFQRRRFDLVALVQPHYKIWEPLAIGIEIKVDVHDLMNDDKIADYLPYVHLFYLAVPSDLEEAALEKMAHLPWGAVGLLLVDGVKQLANGINIGQGITIKLQPNLETHPQPTDIHLKELYAELLLRPFKLAKNNKPHRKLFIQFV